LKSEIDISDAIVMKFKQFWDHFKETPLKGGIPITHLWYPCIIQIHIFEPFVTASLNIYYFNP
jgi:hypothetical protein